MLLRFGCSNYRSIREFQEISLTANVAYKEQADVLLGDGNRQPQGLRVAAIYGANASGKTNIIDGLLFISFMVEASHRAFSPDQKIDAEPFALSKDSPSTESHFECDFISESTKFSYGFSILDGKVFREFLYAFPKGVKQVWYSREEAQQTNNRFQFGRALKGRNVLIADITRSNSLFLSAAAQQDHDQLRPVYTFLSQRIMKGAAIGSDGELLVANLLESDKKDWLLNFISEADTGINTASVVTRDTPPSTIKAISRFFSVLNEEVSESDRSQESKFDFEKLSADPIFKQSKRVFLGHRSMSGDSVLLPWSSESQGTKRLLALMASVLKALETGGVVVVDEIDASLHTFLVKQIIEVFKSPRVNSQGAQLLFTTHDTNILCAGILRRDEIYFVEKTKGGESIVFPLSDFPVRKDDNLEKGYLQGRFGAIPFIGDIKALPN